MLRSDNSASDLRSPSRRSAPRRVLVVEDNHVIAMDIEGVLRDLGAVEVVLAARLREAEAAAEADLWDLAILDQHLAEGETTQLLATSLDEKAVPILRIGADLASVSAGERITLAKPFSRGQLREAIDRVLSVAA